MSGMSPKCISDGMRPNNYLGPLHQWAPFCDLNLPYANLKSHPKPAARVHRCFRTWSFPWINFGGFFCEYFFYGFSSPPRSPPYSQRSPPWGMGPYYDLNVPYPKAKAHRAKLLSTAERLGYAGASVVVPVNPKLPAWQLSSMRHQPNHNKPIFTVYLVFNEIFSSPNYHSSALFRYAVFSFYPDRRVWKSNV